MVVVLGRQRWYFKAMKCLVVKVRCVRSCRQAPDGDVALCIAHVLCSQVWTRHGVFLGPEEVVGQIRGLMGSKYSVPISSQAWLKGLCDLRNYPSCASLFAGSKTTGQLGLMGLLMSDVCTIVTVTLSHEALVTAM